MSPRASVVACALLLMGTADAGAQALAEGPHLRPRRPSISFGAITSGGYPVGEASAELRRNVAGTTSPPPFTLFRAATEVNRAAGVEARAAWPLTPSLALELGGAFSRPGLTVSITGDPEGPSVTVDESRVSQYVVDAALVWQLSRVRLGDRARPFLSAGGGYLRQLYDERTRIETGQLFHVGAGARYWLRGGRGSGRDAGLRGEVRYYLRRQGVEFEGQSRRFPAASVSLFVGL
jgi:hypothetical protein